ncbi:MAG: hypothetical protein WKF75_07085 [Singulisphaera sp.]
MTEARPGGRRTRNTVYDLLHHFLDSATTEGHICQLYELEPEQVAAARAYILNNPDVVLGNYVRIEAKMAETTNSPQVVERAKQTHATLSRFKEWLAQREETEFRERAAEALAEPGKSHSRGFPTFKEWLMERESRSMGGT